MLRCLNTGWRRGQDAAAPVNEATKDSMHGLSAATTPESPHTLATHDPQQSFVRVAWSFIQRPSDMSEHDTKRQRVAGNHSSAAAAKKTAAEDVVDLSALDDGAATTPAAKRASLMSKTVSYDRGSSGSKRCCAAWRVQQAKCAALRRCVRAPRVDARASPLRRRLLRRPGGPQKIAAPEPL